jgi:hypothetical protein
MKVKALISFTSRVGPLIGGQTYDFDESYAKYLAKIQLAEVVKDVKPSNTTNSTSERTSKPKRSKGKSKVASSSDD